MRRFCIANVTSSQLCIKFWSPTFVKSHVCISVCIGFSVLWISTRFNQFIDIMTLNLVTPNSSYSLHAQPFEITPRQFHSESNSTTIARRHLPHLRANSIRVLWNLCLANKQFGWIWRWSWIWFIWHSYSGTVIEGRERFDLGGMHAVLAKNNRSWLFTVCLTRGAFPRRRREWNPKVTASAEK